MKKATVIILGLVMAIFISCHFYIFKIYQANHQSNFRAYISSNLSELEKVEISPSELYKDSKRVKWLDDNKEIMIGDLMYDVVSIKNSGKTVSLYVVNDHKEKSMQEEYVQLASNILNTSESSKPDIIKDFLSLKFLQNTCDQLALSSTYSFSKFHTYELGNVPSVFLSTENPPPITLI